MHKSICHAFGRINVHRYMKNLVARLIKILLKKSLMRGKKGKKVIDMVPRGHDFVSVTFL